MDDCRTIFISCECGCSSIVVRCYANEPTVSFAMLTLAGQSSRLSFCEAIRIACRALFKREVYEDFLLLSYEDAKTLGKWLVNNSKEVNKKL